MDISQSIVEQDDGIIIALEVTTGSKKPRFPDGFNSWRSAIGIAVKAPPVDGKANKAIVELIAEVLHIPKQSITIISGQTSTLKKVKIQGISPSDLSAFLQVENG
ncbi:MAG: YggU family protein [Methanomicrobiales archaeon]|nr:YggU family protein [Methanomicrobiales archaeon]